MAEFLGGISGPVVPVVRDGRVIRIHAPAAERFLVDGRRAGCRGHHGTGLTSQE